MITINGYKDVFILDLNGSMIDKYDFKVDSFNGSSPLSWQVVYVSNININATTYSSDMLEITADLEKITDDEEIILRNIFNEEYKIVVKPNIEASRLKKYLFELGSFNISGSSFTLNIHSRESGNYVPWSVVYSGSPLSYIIEKSDESVTFTLNSVLYTEAESVVILGQDKSGKEIGASLLHRDNDSVEITNIKLS